jgi:two-component system, cell cycle response regulator DivK
LVVVDLKMPLMDGFELLGWLQNRPELESLPAIVISSSDLPADREKAIKLGARDYFVKPNDPADLVKLVEGLHEKWMSGGSAKALKH